MQFMSFHPAVGDIASQLIQIGTDCLEAAAKASMSLTGLAPAGAEEVSAQAVTAFVEEAASMLASNTSAQEELQRTGTALARIARRYTEVDEAAADLFDPRPMSRHPYA
jgi:hypothetical protein